MEAHVIEQTAREIAFQVRVDDLINQGRMDDIEMELVENELVGEVLL